MMLKFWNSRFLIILAVIVFSNFAKAQEESESKQIIWVLIENNKLESDSNAKNDHAKIMRQHMDYLSKIHNQEKMLASISFQGGGGLMFFKSNMDSIKNWMSMDPGIINNLFKLSYYTWVPEKGNICQTDKSSQLGNVQVTFINATAPKDPDLRERIIKRRNKIITDLNASEGTLCLGQIKEGNSYALISLSPAGSEEINELEKINGGGITSNSYKAWAPLSAFCE